jgi:protein-disulfide isomerase
MHDHLMRHHTAVDQRGVIRDAEDTGVDLVRLERDVMKPSVIAGVEGHLDAGGRSGVHSTPAFFFNGVKHEGHYDYETLTGQLEAARSPSRGWRQRAG